MNIELTAQDLKRIKKIQKLMGNKEPLTEPYVWTLVSNALIHFEKKLLEGEQNDPE